MATSLRFKILLIIAILVSFFISRTIAIDPLEAIFTHPPPPPPPQLHSPPFPQDPQDHSFLTHTTLAPILSHLGFHDLSLVVPSLAGDSSISWTGPSTLFAPSDVSLRTCVSCSLPNLLREHIVPGLFTINYLRKLAFGTKIETLSPGRCITVTSDNKANNTDIVASKVFIGGVEITHPDLFNNGVVVVHGIQDRSQQATQGSVQPVMMRLMLRDAMLRLRNNGFTVLSLAMKVKFAELVNLQNMTMFALDDLSIFSGSHAYINNIRFHIVPNRYLTISDLEKLPVGTVMPTLVSGQSLVITTAGVGMPAAPMRINYVRIKVPEVIRNLKIMVHSVFLPFPLIHPTAAAFDGLLGGGSLDGAEQATPEGECSALTEDGGCDINMSPMSQLKTKVVEIEDNHGL